MGSLRIGIDLGGTKIEALALDATGREVFRKRIPTPRGDYAATISAVKDLVREIGEGTVGIGIPGAESRATGLIKNANSTWLIGKPLAKDLEAALGRPVRLENDANCFALSEATGRGGEGRGGGVRGDPRHRRGRRDRGGRKGYSRARTRLRASGGITRCRRRPRPICRIRIAIAAVKAVSRPVCQVRAFRATMRQGPGQRLKAEEIVSLR